MTADLVSAVEHWARETPDAPALEGAGRALSYRELWRGARALAAHLCGLGLPPRAALLVSAHKEPEALIAFVGAGLAGHPYVPLDASLPESRCAVIREAANSPLTLTPADVAAAVARGGEPPARLRADGDVVYVMFTSGSTGRPKGVPITRGNLAAFSRWLLGEQSFGRGERFLDQAIYSFDLSVMSLYPALLTGGALAAVTRDDLADLGRLFRALASSRLSTWVSTPSFAQLCLHEPRFGREMLPELRRFLFCGETLPAATARALRQRFPGCAVWNTYGPTEATVAATSVEVDDALLARFEALPIGRAHAGSPASIVGDALAPVPAGERGEILIAGPQVSPGYLDAERAARAFLDWRGQWAYRTGDLGHEQAGFLFFDGRKDDQIKLNGYRIELGDVEANLAALPGVQAAAVIVVQRPDAADSLAGFVVLEPGAPRGARDAGGALRSALGARVPSYMVPRRIRVLDRLPMTVNGKVDRRALAELPR